jgi:hypothetical protein
MPFPNFSRLIPANGEKMTENQHVIESVLPSTSTQDLMAAEFDGPALPAVPQVPGSGLPGLDSEFAAPSQTSVPTGQPQSGPNEQVEYLNDEEVREFEEYRVQKHAASMVRGFMDRHKLVGTPNNGTLLDDWMKVRGLNSADPTVLSDRLLEEFYNDCQSYLDYEGQQLPNDTISRSERVVFVNKPSPVQTGLSDSNVTPPDHRKRACQTCSLACRKKKRDSTCYD